MKISLRLGTLAEPLQAAAEKSGRTVSEEIRVRLARSLKVPPPEMPEGNPNAAEQLAKARKVRWQRK